MLPLIEAKNLSKTVQCNNQNLRILNKVNLNLYPGEIVAITGASGNGKSTLLHLLGSLDTPSSGEIQLLGKSKEAYDLPAFRNQHIGFIFQNFYLLEDETVINNILIPARIAKKKVSQNSEAYDRAMTLIESIGLSHRIHARCSYLSGGEKQRVAIARSLMNDPEILLADEPSGNLDDKTSEHVHQLLLSQSTTTRGVLIVTHNKQLANQCHRQGVLQNGELIF
ncbi:ABC transporter ATP-binding protein [Chlamydia gallinacea]|uniref:ABC transporter ATP-binding protein n=2 Tax=Chlamydia gallinacea TaxID=1457153 RepID=A0A173E062_9CHLA|nr:ABC transporter ATP-binding protein [Chlamydia gallinacea]EYE60303.1 ABC transporter family protein [Bacteroides fragilis str. S6L5]ANG66546.1 ABC transporter ATP-binding protein [Chlamydia gallinacea 08-1274/3]AQT77271.1 ABC transporter ATP-binding protein [Chlamydia gallinacea]MBX6680211.1 ABC transporter ATP-binding protein [Chlamydia gallinacea]MBX6687822.1 ABC transporter ATP-binding protein [Chlamydia gallinacea]